MKCRHCHTKLKHIFLDLGYAPPSNAYLSKEALCAPETTFPLKLYVCDQCWLVQTEDYSDADELFSGDYAYFSSTSQSWLKHAARYTESITKRLGLSINSFVIEVASNDGYLLKNFVAAGIPCLGVEPTDSTADAAEKIGGPVLRKFFDVITATALAEAGVASSSPSHACHASSSKIAGIRGSASKDLIVRRMRSLAGTVTMTHASIEARFASLGHAVEVKGHILNPEDEE